MIAPITKADLMSYGRVDDDAAGALLLELAEQAEEYLQECGIQYNVKTNAGRWVLLVKALSLFWLDHPEGGSIPESAQRVINQLKLAGPSL